MAVREQGYAINEHDEYRGKRMALAHPICIVGHDAWVKLTQTDDIITAYLGDGDIFDPPPLGVFLESRLLFD